MFMILYILLVFIILFWYYNKFIKNTSPKYEDILDDIYTPNYPTETSTVLEGENNLDKNDIANIQKMIIDGRKIEAIKMILEKTKLGLVESKNIADDIEASMQHNGNNPNPKFEKKDKDMNDDKLKLLTQKVKEYIKQGDLIMAVKYVKDETGWGLKESKDFVDTIRDTKDNQTPSAKIDDGGADF